MSFLTSKDKKSFYSDHKEKITSNFAVHLDKWTPGSRHLKSILFSSPCFMSCQIFHHLLAGPVADFLLAFLWGEGRITQPNASPSDQYLMMTQDYQESRFIIKCSYLFLVKCSIFYCSPRMTHKPCLSRQIGVGGAE